MTELEVLPPNAPGAENGLHLFRGILSFFHRERPTRIRIITRSAAAYVEGTEFVLAVDSVGGRDRTTLSLINGIVTFSNEVNQVTLTDGQESFAEEGMAPSPPRGFIANNLLQWCFYYPAVIDLAELPLSAEEERLLAQSLTAYREGDLPSALARYPAGREPGSEGERVYYAALLLSVGQVEPAQKVLAGLPADAVSERLNRLASALRTLIAAVKREPNPSSFEPQLASEWLAASYYEQSQAVPGREEALRRALAFASRAVLESQEFGFGWARVADLQFSFGRIEDARKSLERSLALAPHNAQSLALQGFLLAAENRIGNAMFSFYDALAVDPFLGNAWFGRGLCRFRRGDTRAGREDLLVATALEPRRAGIRSYLGKADAEVGDYRRADKELEQAKTLDPNDPTPWLYSALLKQRENRINEAVRDLEKSQELNDNRSVYRSSLLLIRIERSEAPT
jgi:tetratricopeptide (TPR) repeat protein